MSPRIPLALSLALPLLAACEVPDAAAPVAEAPPAVAEAPAEASPDPAPDPAPAPVAAPVAAAAPAAIAPPSGVSVEDLDATSEEEVAAALAPPVEAPAGALGTTTATLGPPGDDGIWLETPLVSEPTSGRVVYGATGASIAVELRPSGGEPGSGSQISLAAIRALEAPLTGILELEVFGG